LLKVTCICFWAEPEKFFFLYSKKIIYQWCFFTILETTSRTSHSFYQNLGITHVTSSLFWWTYYSFLQPKWKVVINCINHVYVLCLCGVLDFSLIFSWVILFLFVKIHCLNLVLPIYPCLNSQKEGT
jgi:hypothetical protein